MSTSTRSTSTAYSRARHRFALALACVVVLLIAAGALVKSKDAGLSVPDWPLSYGTLNPPRWWLIETVRAEHGHRLFAGSVALATVALAFWTWRAERRRNVRRLGWFAVAAVFAQALLGGLTVLLFLPPAVSIAHAALAEIFLGLITSLAVVTSRSWLGEGTPTTEPPFPAIESVRKLALATSLTIFVQILVGAFVRHLGAGLAIPDFPLVFGGLWPRRFDLPISIHYTHRLGAVLVTTLIAILTVKIFRGRGLDILKRPIGAMAFLVACQIGLGGWLVLSGRAVVPNTVHVATGAAIFALSLVVTLQSFRLARRAENSRVSRREALSAHASPSATDWESDFSNSEARS